MPKKILYVDNEMDQNELLKNIISSTDYSVHVCTGVPEAINQLDQEHYPLVFANIQMPGMEDLKLCSQIRESNPKVIIYALSEYISELTSETLDAAGFDGYLRKPYNLNKLMKAIGGAFQRLGYC